MSTPHLSQIRIRNYRVFDSIEIGDFRWINVIGGKNGGGKSTLLEALFFLMDRANPLSIIRPLQWRNLPQDFTFAKETLFANKDQNELHIWGKMKSGSCELSYVWEPQAMPVSQAVKIRNNPQEPLSGDLDAKTESSVEGFSVEVRHDNVTVLKRGIVPQDDGFLINDKGSQLIKLAQSIMLSRHTMHFANDISRRYSEVARQGRKKEIIKIAQKINDQIEDLELFQIGNTSILYVNLAKGAMVPVSLAGDGALTMLSIGLAIMNARGGMVFIDEFDAAIHYSMLPEIWVFIVRLAKEYNCQIFAATHSRECIDAALDAIVRLKAQSDFAYYRMDRVDGRSQGTRYSADEMIGAAQGEWEVR